MSLQSRILKKSKNLKMLKKESLKKNIEFNPNYFLTSWADSIGYLNIKLFLTKRFQLSKNIKLYLKNFIQFIEIVLNMRINLFKINLII